MPSRRSLFEELSRFSGSGVETRAENSFNVAIRFMELLESDAVDDKAYDLMMKSWFRAVKDRDFSKFRRTYRKYTNSG